MTKKHVAFGAKPSAKQAESPQADAWVQSREAEPMKRLTIDVPLSLHGRIKAQCAMRGVKMADEVRVLLEQHFPEGGKA